MVLAGVVNTPLLINRSCWQPDGSVLIRDPALSYGIVVYNIPLYEKSGQSVPAGAEGFVVIGADQIRAPGIRVAPAATVSFPGSSVGVNSGMPVGG